MAREQYRGGGPFNLPRHDDRRYDRGDRRGLERDPPYGRQPPPAYNGHPGDNYPNSKVNPMYGREWRDHRQEETEDFKIRDEQARRQRFGPQKYIPMNIFIIVVVVLSVVLLLALGVAVVTLIITLSNRPNNEAAASEPKIAKFNVDVKLNQDWDQQMGIKYSAEFNSTTNTFCTEISKILTNTIFGCEVLSLKEGSIDVNSILTVKYEEIIKGTLNVAGYIEDEIRKAAANYQGKEASYLSGATVLAKERNSGTVFAVYIQKNELSTAFEPEHSNLASNKSKELIKKFCTEIEMAYKVPALRSYTSCNVTKLTNLDGSVLTTATIKFYKVELIQDASYFWKSISVDDFIESAINNVTSAAETTLLKNAPDKPVIIVKSFDEFRHIVNDITSLF